MDIGVTPIDKTKLKPLFNIDEQRLLKGNILEYRDILNHNRDNLKKIKSLFNKINASALQKNCDLLSNNIQNCGQRINQMNIPK